jgi:hypothetical protein
MSFPFPTISSNSGSLNSGSYFLQSDLDNFIDDPFQEYYFGNSEQDIVEFSVYDINGNINYWKYLPLSPTYNVLNKTYKDVDNRTLSYSYKQYNSSYTISFNKNILFNVLNDLSSSNINSGNHVVSYNFIRNVAGNPKYQFLIKEISNSRREIKLTPSFKLDVTNEENVLIYLQYQSFVRKSALIRDTIPLFNYFLDSYEIYKDSDKLINDNKEIFSLLRTNFGFKSDADVLSFLDDTYNGFNRPFINSQNGQLIQNTFEGTKNYIKDWLYTNYRSIYSFDEIKNQFSYIVQKSVSIRLNQLNSYYVKNNDLTNKIENFIIDLFFTNFISVTVDAVKNYHDNKLYAYLKNALNFGNNIFYTILNYTFVEENGNTNIIVKLFEELPLNVSLRDRCWVSNISLVPVIQKFVINVPKIRKNFKISGPNFKVPVDSYKTSPVNYQNLNDLKLDLTTQTDVDFYKKLNNLNVDYSNFSNFIVFSSAELRTKLFLNKITSINQLNKSINSILTTLSASSANSASSYTLLSSYSFISASYADEVNNYKNQLNTIFNSFDGYDTYLYKNITLVSGSTTSFVSGAYVNNYNYPDYINNAIEFDKNNKDSLVNNTPEYILLDDNNTDYLIFLSMIGHHFDNIYLYIKNFPTQQYVENNLSSSYISTVANTLLQQFGWDPISSFDNSSIESNYLTGSNAYSDYDKLKIVWNRILKNLPLIYKTKGTEECIRIISNIYGIPRSLLNVKEYGGNNISSEDNSSYSYQNKYYFTKYTRNGDAIVIPISGSSNYVNSIEFKFRIDSDFIYPQNVPVYLLKTTNWDVSIRKEIKNTFGKIKFDLTAFGNSNDYLESDSLPLFNGNVFNVLIKQINLSASFDTGSGGQLPYGYYMRVTSVDNDQIVFDSKKSIISSTENINYNFNEFGNLYVGNYTGGGNLFQGNIDKINLWKHELDDESFIEHCKNFDSYKTNNDNTTYDNLYFRYSYDYPVDMYTGSFFVVRNANKLYSQYSASAYNFVQNTVTQSNCLTISASLYPYQFDEIEIIQNIKLDKYGPNKFKNQKINKSYQTLESRLMPNETSAINDINNTDSNILSVYISPFKVRDDDILNFLGEFDLMDFIGNPSSIYNKNYEELKNLRESYNKYNLSETVLYQEFITLYKNYFDGSFFETVKQLLPARTKVIDGILIEPSLLERNKYQSQPINSALAYELDLSYEPLLNFSTSFEKNYTTINQINLSKNGTNLTPSSSGFPSSYSSNNFTSFQFSSINYDKRLSLFSISGSFFDNDYDKKYIYKNINKVYISGKNINDIQNYLSKSLNSYSYVNIDSSSLFNNYDNNFSNLDTESYPFGHLSLKRRISRFSTNQYFVNSGIGYFYKKSSQNSYTTIDENGINDNSSPIERTLINLQVSENSLISS